MREIIITDVQTSPGAFRVTAYLWLQVPGKRGYRGRQTSHLPEQGESAPWGITAEEQAYFAKGVLCEQVVTLGPFAEGGDQESVRAALLVAHEAAQAELDATASGALDIVGSSWDGSSWSGK